MKLSHYLKQYPWEERPAYTILFSTKKASKILIPRKKFQSIENGTLSLSDEEMLAELGMIVPDREEEKRSVLNLIDGVNKKSTGLNALVILNLDCNFACVYCYEGDMKGMLYMSDETASCVIDFIKQRFTEDKTSLLIDFYGGEPLLSTPLIKSISGELQSFCQERGASYGFTLVTNGSLFTKRVAEDLVPLGLEAIKITLDGPEHIHNRHRPFKSGKGSFATIIRNIKDTCGIVKVGLGGNFERDNWEKFVLLLDYMEEEGLTPEKIASVKFDPVMNTFQGEPSPTDYRDGCMSVNEPWVSEASLFLREEILKRGHNTPNMGPIICAVEKKDSYTVNYDGVIYKCPAFVGKKGFAVGDVRRGVEDYTASYRLGIWKNEECSECAYLPLCFGGCRYATFIRQGNIDALDCERAYLDTSLETMIKQEIKYGR